MVLFFGLVFLIIPSLENFLSTLLAVYVLEFQSDHAQRYLDQVPLSLCQDTSTRRQ